MIDPYSDYVTVLKECFDFPRLSSFLKERPEFSILFDGMHGAGGPFAQRILVEELGVPEVRGQTHFFLCLSGSHSPASLERRL